MTTGSDPRLTPARGDLAAAHLKGKVESAAFAEPRKAQAVRAVVGLFRQPDEPSGQQTQILFGETFDVYEEKNGWAWGQCGLDGYVGFARAKAFAPPEAPTHRVQALSTPLFVAPDVKHGARQILPLNAKVSLADPAGRFVALANGQFVFARHLARLDAVISDWVSVAERFVGVPYVWGGKTWAGIDCSGLVQTALETGGVAAPRDSDMMESGLGIELSRDAPLKRGDLIFWKGHVGIMLDAARLIHANGFHMQVSIEPLALVDERTKERESLPIRTIRRL
ncbi:MAG TPA: C40 family peptidase [Micropepsaceae bacterium]|nr:C40 family peptidase [Micropepsaceae bacterium]